jgi:hypothetical protein
MPRRPNKPIHRMSAPPCQSKLRRFIGRSSSVVTMLAIISAVFFATGFMIIKHFFYYPTEFGCIALPGAIIAILVAAMSVTCFFLSPIRPVTPKVVTLLLTVPALLFAMDCIYSYLYHLQYHAK